MSVNVLMPALSPTMEEGTLAKWHVKEGDTVNSGDVIAEIETDKATMEVEAVDEGTVGKILVDEGTEGVKVNAVIAVLLEEGEDASAIDEAPAPPPAKGNGQDAGASKTKEKAPETAAPKAEAAPRTPAAPPAPKAPAAKDGQSGGRVFASPLARRLAKEAGIDLSRLVGSGPHGRVVKSDIEAAKAGTAEMKAAPATGAAAPMATAMSGDQVKALYEEGSYDVVPNDGMRKTVASRLTEAKQTVPHFYLTIDCRIDNLMAARADINAAAPKAKDGTPDYKLSVNDFIMKAWAMALQQVPKANATWAGDSILYHHHSDVAMAVAIPGGLFTPVIKACESKTLSQISREAKDFATRARSKKLAPHEYQGGATAVSNLGMYGIREFSAVINPPHGTILAVGAGEERVYAEKGEIKTGTFMTVTLSCDHRSVDGALGAELLAAFRKLIEAPVRMLA